MYRIRFLFILALFFSFFDLKQGFAFTIKDPFIEKSSESIKKIEIQYIYSDGKITTTSDLETSMIRVYGRQEALDALRLYKEGASLKLKYDKSKHSDDNLKVYIEVYIPRQADLDMSVIDGEWSIDSLIGNVKLKSYGDGYFVFQNLDSEEAELTLNGSGNIDIKGGVIEKFKAKILGSGAIDFYGMTEEADFEIIGSGQLKINQVLEKIVNQTIFGSGKVKIKSPPSTFRIEHKKEKKLDLEKEELDTAEVKSK